MKVKERKNQKGITLIALVITIIVLLILAGVTLSIVFNGGIINKSQTAVDKYSEESAKEKLSLAIFNYKMGKITGEAGEGEGQKTFAKYIEEIGGEITVEDDTAYTIEVDGYEFSVTKNNYEITSNGPATGESPSIVSIAKEASADNKSATIKVTASATKGGTLKVTIGGKEATLENGTYNLTVTKRDPYTVIVEETGLARKAIGSIKITEEDIEVKYTITYNANGGTGSMEAGEKTEGTEYTIASNGFTAATGYEFKEWNTQADGKGTTYTENQSYSTEANLILYAIWNKTTYSIGDTVTIGEEQFYVLADSQDEVTLIAKYNLGTSKVNGEWKQVPNTASGDTACAFCSKATYTALGSFKEGEDLNDNTTVKADTTSAVYKAKEYAKTVTGDSTNNTGRLLTKGEADKLQEWTTSTSSKTTEEKNKIKTMLWGKENKQGSGSSSYYLYYWLGSARTTSHVSDVYGDTEGFGFSSYYYDNDYGVRPVLTVSKSSDLISVSAQ